MSHLVGCWNIITNSGVDSHNEVLSTFESLPSIPRNVPDFIDVHDNRLSFIDGMTNDELTSYLFDNHFDYGLGVDRSLIYSSTSGLTETPERVARLEYITNNIESENVDLIGTSFDFWMRT